MEKFETIIIGGGAAGLFFATAVNTKGGVLLLERMDRLGKKLSATGNGQGNLTNTRVKDTPYFSHAKNGADRVKEIISRYSNEALIGFFRSLGGVTVTDERGRVYPASRQASSITDLLRYEVEARGVEVRFSSFVKGIEKTKDGFILSVQTPEGEGKVFGRKVLLATGGKAAKNFGTDGNGYELAKSLGHTLTPLTPSLVQLKTDTRYTKTLKGLRASGACVSASVDGKTVATVKGDLIFTDYGVSGDTVFRLSAFLSGKEQGAELHIDFLPELSKEELLSALTAKRKAFPSLPDSELFCGILNNQIGRAVVKRVESGSLETLVSTVKRFTLPVMGSLGFDYAQVTKGGVNFDEVDDTLQSKKAKGLYFAGEIVDVDGECGGFNLQWAFSSARVVAEAINRGQV